MEVLKERINRIKAALEEGDLKGAGALLVTTISSDDLFAYWERLCQGSERVPKILRYIHHIEFNVRVPTAEVNFNEGDLRLGVRFFLAYIDGPEDLLLVLVHERNHVILRRLFPEVVPGSYPRKLFGYAEDCYINAIARRYIPSTLPERFYSEPFELLLTGAHSKIDWDFFKIDDGYGNNLLKEAHADLYRKNHRLLQAIGEGGLRSGYDSSYSDWMDLMRQWHEGAQMKPRSQAKEVKSREEQKAEKEADGPSSEEGGESDPPDDPEPTPEGDESGEEEKADPEASGEPGEAKTNSGDDNNDGEGPETEPEAENDPEAPETHSDSEKQREDGDEWDFGDRDQNDDGDEGPGEESGSVDDDESDNGSDGEGEGVDALLEKVVSIVAPEESQGAEAGEGWGKGDGDIEIIPLPDISPYDPIVRMILETCEIDTIRPMLAILEGEPMRQVEGLITGILSDRATHRTYDGYSVDLPLTLTRRDAFSLATGTIPAIWQKRLGVEVPEIELYVDVSGSMESYYPLIPYIYSALRHVMGRVHQFSTVVITVDPGDKFLRTTGGTDFNVVANHMITTGVRAAIVVSDGQGSLGSRLITHLQMQLRELIYIKVMNCQYRNWELVATEVITLRKGP